MKRAVILFFLIFSFFAVGFNISASEDIQSQSVKKRALFFYQKEDCPHCQNVDKYFQENSVYDNYEIKKVEVTGFYNLDYLNSFFDAFEVSQEKRGCPVIFFNKTFLIGDKPIIENFINEIEKEAAIEFPTPEIIESDKQLSISSNEIKIFRIETFFLLFRASLADITSPCSLAVIIILLSIIIFGQPENKKEIIVFSSFFLLAVFTAYLSLGIGMFGFSGVFKLSKEFGIFLGLVSILVGVLILRIHWVNIIGIGRNKLISQAYNQLTEKIKIDLFKSLKKYIIKSQHHFKKFLQKTHIIISAVLLGFLTSGFLLPCSDRPYGSIIKFVGGSNKISSSTLVLVSYNLIYTLLFAFLAVIIYWCVNLGKLNHLKISEKEKMLKTIIGAIMIFVGIYLIHNWL